jgi:hypothetical protein
MKTSEPTGPALDWAVAKAEGRDVSLNDYGTFIPWTTKLEPTVSGIRYRPSTYWSQGGPIIEREKIAIEFTPNGNWRACIEWLDEPSYEGFGPTPLIAAMRCFVASKLGTEVEIPEELTR